MGKWTRHVASGLGPAVGVLVFLTGLVSGWAFATTVVAASAATLAGTIGGLALWMLTPRMEETDDDE